MEMSNEWGSDFLEAVYQETLEMELEERKNPFAAELPIESSHKGNGYNISSDASSAQSADDKEVRG